MVVVYGYGGRRMESARTEGAEGRHGAAIATLGETPRRDRGKSPREAWRKRGGEQQRKPWYNPLMAQRARNKGRGKGRPSDDAWF